MIKNSESMFENSKRAQPKRPVVTFCRSKEIRNKSCTNMNSRLFEIRALKDKDGDVMSWEIECPICGTVWYKDVYREPQKELAFHKRKHKS